MDTTNKFTDWWSARGQYISASGSAKKTFARTAWDAAQATQAVSESPNYGMLPPNADCIQIGESVEQYAARRAKAQAVSEPVAWQWSVGGTPPWNDCDEETYRKQAKWPGVKVRTLGVLEEK